ncbi:uncharacterized protein RSE6_09084 [Rhynchosporium secalis]|uniref:Uncharacterized protein n=1 Tax=Rhynchosporium secalis TaxID=38038 RepID=A0A1E1MH21_RHYSE|nr:uncharacterized protein RSE6_09084 [Rhynchosporium secalis]
MNEQFIGSLLYEIIIKLATTGSSAYVLDKRKPSIISSAEAKASALNQYAKIVRNPGTRQ